MENKEILGMAIWDYYKHGDGETFKIHYNNHSPDAMSMDVFFRELDEMPLIEQHALSLTRGSVLDVGAGAGAHSLVLQSWGFDVTAMDYSQKCCKVMRERGLRKVINADIFEYEGQQFQTLLLLMNGIGLAQTIDRVPSTLRKLLELVKPGGQVLFDSSNVSYLYNEIEWPEFYFGEIDNSFEYKGKKGDFSKWLYIDPHKLIEICNAESINVEILLEDATGLYLARIYH